MKFLFALLFLTVSGTSLLAQTISDSDSMGSGRLGVPDSSATASPSPAAGDKKPGAQAPPAPTVIDSNSMEYDQKTGIAIFTGEDYGVYVKDPSFVVYCDKLTAYMSKGAGPGPGAPGAKGKAPSTPRPTPVPAPKGKASAAAATPAKGGLQRALCEGNSDRPVVIVQDKPPANPGEAPQHNVGIALKADYHADTGDVILTGWPRVSQGINTQIATASYTVMTMNKDGHTMKTTGPSRTVIQEQDQTKKTGASSPASDSSPSPSPQ
jgi:lipopolysaccharide export system protein LptA